MILYDWKLQYKILIQFKKQSNPCDKKTPEKVTKIINNITVFITLYTILTNLTLAEVAAEAVEPSPDELLV